MLPAAAQEDACYAKNGNWLSDTQTCRMSAGVHVDVDYPLEMAQYPAAAKVIDAFVLDQQKSFISSYTPDYSLPSYANDWTMNITNETYKYSEDIQTVVFNISFYTGGAHPNSGYKSFTFDLKNSKELTLNDVFLNGTIPWDTISQLAQDSLKTQLGDMADPTFIEPGTGTNPDNYKSWALTPNSLIFFFDPYQVAPYAAGPQKVEIPFATLHTSLAPAFAA
jgi:hypothetical protein